MNTDALLDDPNYRFGVIMGRMQAITEVMALFAPGADQPDDLPGQLRDIVLREDRLATWLEQSRTECDLETEMLQAELARAELTQG
ncbi:hypothetical protein [Brevundimonas sp. GCM10030266]|uniref:hypothetical protein n=1 Tax=Brevundimonas sp. GCM10030266 TaxID=3273386 RepID=UPI00361E5373